MPPVRLIYYNISCGVMNLFFMSGANGHNESSDNERRVTAAVEMLWNSNLGGADRELEVCLEENKENVPAALHYAQVGWLRAVLSEQHDDGKDAFGRLDLCRGLCKK